MVIRSRIWVLVMVCINEGGSKLDIERIHDEARLKLTATSCTANRWNDRLHGFTAATTMYALAILVPVSNDACL